MMKSELPFHNPTLPDHKVFKYQFQISDTVIVRMPRGAKIIHVGQQSQSPYLLCLWAIIDPIAELEDRKIFVRGTGHDLGEAARHPHIATVQGNGGFVWHLFGTWK